MKFEVRVVASDVFSRVQFSRWEHYHAPLALDAVLGLQLLQLCCKVLCVRVCVCVCL